MITAYLTTQDCLRILNGNRNLLQPILVTKPMAPKDQQVTCETINHALKALGY